MATATLLQGSRGKNNKTSGKPARPRGRAGLFCFQQKGTAMSATFNSELQQEWKANFGLLRQIPPFLAWRACIGLAAYTTIDAVTGYPEEDSPRRLIPGEYMRWSWAIDVPPCRFGDKDRPVLLVSDGKASVRWGMPTIGPAESTWDFHYCPFGSFVNVNGQKVEAQGDILNADLHPRLFRLFNKVNTAMTSTAARYRKRWQLFAEKMPFGGKLRFGAVEKDRAERSLVWLPIPLIPFPEGMTDDLFQLHAAGRRIPSKARLMFCREVERTRVTGEEWQKARPIDRWRRLLPHMLGDDFVWTHYRPWFYSQLVHLDGCTYLPAPMGSVLGREFAVRDADILWDVTDAMTYFDASVDGWIFPTVSMVNWKALKGNLAWDVVYDFAPRDQRFLAFPVYNRRVPRIGGPAVTGSRSVEVSTVRPTA